MSKFKGFGTTLVVWSTGRSLRSDDTSAEWIYTILSRTTGLLVIRIDAETPPDIARVISQRDSKRLMFWTRRAEEAFDAMSSSESILRVG